MALCCPTSVKAPSSERCRRWTTAALRCSTVRLKHQRAKHLPQSTHTFAYTNTCTSNPASRGRRLRSRRRWPERSALLSPWRVRQPTFCDSEAACRRLRVRGHTDAREHTVHHPVDSTIQVLTNTYKAVVSVC